MESSNIFDPIVKHSMEQILCLKCISEKISHIKGLSEHSAIAVKNIHDNYYKLKKLDSSIALKYNQNIGDFLVESGVSLMLRRISCHLLDESWFNIDGSVNNWTYRLFYNSYTVLYNFSESSECLSIELCACDFFFDVLLSHLYNIHRQETDNQTIHESLRCFMTYTLGLLLNCSYIEENRQRLVGLNISSLLFDFVKYSKDKVDRLCSILLLANILTDDENEKFQADTEGIQFLVTSLSEALENHEHRSDGFTAIELTLGIRQLSCNDNNKKLLVDHGVLKVLHSMLALPEVSERRASMETLLSLSFINVNKEQMIAEDGIIKKVYEIWASSHDKPFKKIAHRTLWNLRDNLLKESRKSLQYMGQHVNVLDGEKGRDSDKHIMISYSWKQQELVMKIRDELQRRRFRTWMDVDHMDGSTVVCMANAIENSDVVLVCMSSDYRNSENCRLELEYAHMCKKRIIPLKCQSDYKPDGWLGFILGSKLYYDFSGKYSFASRMDSLVKSVGDCGKLVDVVDS